MYVFFIQTCPGEFHCTCINIYHARQYIWLTTLQGLNILSDGQTGCLLPVQPTMTEFKHLFLKLYQLRKILCSPQDGLLWVDSEWTHHTLDDYSWPLSRTRGGLDTCASSFVPAMSGRDALVWYENDMSTGEGGWRWSRMTSHMLCKTTYPGLWRIGEKRVSWVLGQLTHSLSCH